MALIENKICEILAPFRNWSKAPEIAKVGQLIIQKTQKLTEAHGATKDINGWSAPSVAENMIQWEKSNRYT
jgi:hypothetical protein